MSVHFIFLRFFYCYSNAFPHYHLFDSLSEEEVPGVVEEIRQTWWSDPANPRRVQAARVERERNRHLLDLMSGRIPALPSATSRRESGSSGAGPSEGDAPDGTRPGAEVPPVLQCFDVYVPESFGEPKVMPPFEEIARVAGWRVPPSEQPHTLPDRRRQRIPHIDGFPPYPRTEIAFPPRGEEFHPYGISKRFQLARFASKDLAEDVASALQERVAELADAANLKCDRDAQDVFFVEANPRFFVVSTSDLSRAECIVANERIQRLQGPISGTPSVEELFLREYLPILEPLLREGSVNAEDPDAAAAGIGSRGIADPVAGMAARGAASGSGTPKRLKRSTGPNDARDKLIAALTKHHQYDNGSCLNTAPINNNALARLADVDPASASRFFKKEFVSHQKYTTACRDATRLSAMLKHLNGEYTAFQLFGKTSPKEGNRDDE